MVIVAVIWRGKLLPKLELRERSGAMQMTLFRYRGPAGAPGGAAGTFDKYFCPINAMLGGWRWLLMSTWLSTLVH